MVHTFNQIKNLFIPRINKKISDLNTQVSNVKAELDNINYRSPVFIDQCGNVWNSHLGAHGAPTIQNGGLYFNKNGLKQCLAFRGKLIQSDKFTIQAKVACQSFANAVYILLPQNTSPPENHIMWSVGRGSSSKDGNSENKIFAYNGSYNAGSTTLALNTVYNLEYDLDFTNQKLCMFVNGVKEFDDSFTFSDPKLNDIYYIGGRLSANAQSQSNFWAGYIYKLRISKILRHTADYTPNDSTDYAMDYNTVSLFDFGG